MELRIARAFGRVDVDQFMSEISPEQYMEQAAYEVIAFEAAVDARGGL